jgi:hypothetical protein
MSNLYDAARVIPFRPRLHPRPDGSMAQVPPCWSPPQLQILQSEYADRLMQWVSNLLARDDLHICAVSPAAVCALRESDSMNNPLLMPHYTITVIYQDRITPAASEPVDQFAAAA